MENIWQCINATIDYWCFCCCYYWWLWCWWCLTGHDVCRPCHKQYGKTLLLLIAKTSKKNFPELLVLIMKMVMKVIMKMIMRRLVISNFCFLTFPIPRVSKFQQPESQRTDVSFTTLITGEMYWIWISRKSVFCDLPAIDYHVAANLNIWIFEYLNI